MSARLVNYLHSIHPLSTGLREHLYEILRPQEIKKREKLLRSGQICTKIYFIEKGLFRCSYTEHFKEVCVWFMKEGDVIVSVNSFFRQTPGYQAIQAMEDGRVYSITHGQLQDIYHRFPEFNFTGRVLLEKYYALSEERLRLARIRRVEERYANWLKEYPDLAQRIPAKYVAAYLGTTIETLSRIKRKK
ncbi:MAG: Crp/Fnr family transcriptional regulator [Bacteroidota bacterium]|nr:Crp/Fnr family transcriptional regulator [Bacteroidota bacterium]MDP4217439.1 Crp/Fnr family transcriptional regulator [Bacteroidota bacterium]MDP4247628.1 Crp/Fnr family transcriptional regulator [Bacteroidota bacterium]MDP4254070.1 Crp/Fnr family transcriptional regulator [Bacteroidota bacterium]MDP4260698.1 Crp/Fnr family transcriptional regulator [Bacteroidota bacterium]